MVYSIRRSERTRKRTKGIHLFQFLQGKLSRPFTAPARVDSQSNEEIRPVRYALLGAGSAARSHLRDIATKPGVTLVGIVDPADFKSWKISSDYATVPRFTNAARLFSETRPDLVSICTPTKFHHELALLAMTNGAHVICEKPMAMTINEAEEMEGARLKLKRLGAVNFSYRNLTAFRFARALIASGNLGRIRRINVVYLQSFRGLLTSTWSWRSDAELAGFGALGDLGAHMIDTVRFVTGLDFRRVVASAQIIISERADSMGRRHVVTTDTNGAFLAEMTKGVVATFEASQVASGYVDFFRLEVSGERGTIVADSDQPEGLWYVGVARRQKTNTHLRRIPPKFVKNAPPRLPDAILHTIRGAQTQFPTFADGVAVQRVLHALVGSVQSAGWISVGDPS